jgi:ABC-type transport system involved in cytochrome c biogenesis permease subunit
MNVIAKYVIATICVLILAYVAWLVITTTFPLGEWLDTHPPWKNIFELLIIVGVIGFLAGLVEAKTRT